jgi:hypothetical protein
LIDFAQPFCQGNPESLFAALHDRATHWPPAPPPEICLREVCDLDMRGFGQVWFG